MKRHVLILLLVALLSSPLQMVNAASMRDQIPPIVLNSENGELDAMVFLGLSTETTSIPMTGTVSVKACASEDCETYSVPYLSSVDSFSGHRWLSARVLIGQRFNKSVITLQFPIDITDVSKGWSAPSNAITGWTNPATWYQGQSGKPTIQVLFSSLDSTSMSKADLCSNYNPAQTYTSSISAFQQMTITGYTSAKYDLYHKNEIVRTVDLSASLSSNTGLSYAIPACGSNAFSPFSMTRIDNLSPGRSYKLIYTITGSGKTDLIATLDFVTPGGCPTGEVLTQSAPRPMSYGVTDADGTLLSYAQLGFASWRLESFLGKHLAPIYYSASKTAPFNGRLHLLKTSTEKWKYISSLDDWAQVVESATNFTTATVLKNTVFTDCTSSQIKTTLSIDETLTPAGDQSCVVANNIVTPTKIGPCYVKATVDNASVSATRVRAQAAAATVRINYSISSLSSIPSSSNAPSDVQSSPVVSKRPTVRISRTVSGKSLATYAKLKMTTSSKLTLKVVPSSSKVCRIVGTSVRGLKVGTCKVTITVKPKKGTSKSKTISLTVKK